MLVHVFQGAIAHGLQPAKLDGRASSLPYSQQKRVQTCGGWAEHTCDACQVQQVLVPGLPPAP